MNFLQSNFSEYFLSLIYINVFIYTLLVYNIFSFFFLFDIKYVKSLVDLKNMNYLEGVTSCIILTFLSLAGIPPLLGFISKFYLFIFFISNTNLFVLFLIIIFNFFVMFFYIQNIRFLVSSNPKNYFNIKNNFVFWDKSMLLFIIILNFLSIFSILIVDDILVFYNCVFSYLF